jgi:membrane protein YdbS with pleckstrin-like domain
MKDFTTNLTNQHEQIQTTTSIGVKVREVREVRGQKLFPVFLVIAAVVFLNILAYYRNGCVIIGSLANLTFTMLLFLLLIMFFYEINKHLRFYEIKKVGVFIKQKFLIKIIEVFRKYFYKHETGPTEEKESPREIEKADIISEQHDGLLEIKRENVSQTRQESASLEERVYSVLFIVCFLVFAYLRVTGIFKVMPLSYVEDY